VSNDDEAKASRNNNMATFVMVYFFVLAAFASSLIPHEISALAFTTSCCSTKGRRRRDLNIASPSGKLFAFFGGKNSEEEEIGGDDEDENNDDEAWEIALKERQMLFQKQRSETRKRWLKAEFKQTILGIPDWVRRVSVRWPLAACGSAGGDVYVVHCETGKLIGKGGSEEDQRRYSDVPLETEEAKTMLELFGLYDGGGTLAVGLSWNNVVAHAGRKGGIELWKIDDNDNASEYDDDSGAENIENMKSLISCGMIMDNILVTALVWAEDNLWIGTEDGRVLVFTFDDDDVELDMLYEWKDMGGGSILSLTWNADLDVAVATTSSGSVELLTTMGESDYRRSTFYPPFADTSGISSMPSASNNDVVFPLCATIAEEEESSTTDFFLRSITTKRNFSVVCGGNDGSIWVQSLRINNNINNPELDMDNSFGKAVRELLPGHYGPCKCVVSPLPGVLLSGGQDGSLNVFSLNKDSDDEEAKYKLNGFKVWLGSLSSTDDGKRLITDGADNAISILNFGESLKIDLT